MELVEENYFVTKTNNKDSTDTDRNILFTTLYKFKFFIHILKLILTEKSFILTPP